MQMPALQTDAAGVTGNYLVIWSVVQWHGYNSGGWVHVPYFFWVGHNRNYPSLLLAIFLQL